MTAKQISNERRDMHSFMETSNNPFHAYIYIYMQFPEKCSIIF